MKIFDVIIVGGGASGLMCSACLKDKSSLIIDKRPLGKKLLATGNGRCNFTNKNLDKKFYNTSLVDDAFKEFDNFDLIKYFKNIGVEHYFDEEGRVYPLSDTAKDVKDALVMASNSEFVLDEVYEIEKKDYFIVKTSNGEYFSKNVVMACGNECLEALLKHFKLNFEGKRHVLTGFKVKNYDKSLMGVRENVNLVCSKFGFYEKGQIQFKKDGISGIVAFNLSARVRDKKDFPFEISLQLLPETDENQLLRILENRKNTCERLLKKDVLMGILKPETAKVVLKRSNIKDLDSLLKNMTDEEIKRITQNIKNFTLICEELYAEGQVLAGGVKLEKLNGFESEIKGLFFVGETTNVYGSCGGYNLQWAFTSGYLTGKKLNEKN